MADFEVDLDGEIRNLEDLRKKLDDAWPTAKAEERPNIEKSVPEITIKITHLENLRNLQEASRITISGLTSDEKAQMDEALRALHRVIQQDQTVQKILGTMTTILEGIDLITKKGGVLSSKNMSFAAPNNHPTTQGKSEDLKKAQEEEAIAEAKKKKAEYDKAAAEAQKATVEKDWEREKLQATRELGLAQAQADILSKLFPKGEAKPLEGKVDIKDVGPVARLVAYHAMGEIAAEIAAAIEKVLKEIKTAETAETAETKETEATKVMIIPLLDFASGDLPLLEIMEQFDLFEKLLSARIEENWKILQEEPAKALYFALPAIAPMAASILAMAGAIIPGMANLAGFFKTDYSITGYEFDLDKEGLIARVAGEMSKTGREVCLYNFYTLWDLAELPIIKKFAQLNSLSLDLQSSKEGLAERMKMDATAGKDTADADKALKASQALLDAVKNYVQAITTKAAGEDYPRLVRAALRDRVRQMKITHLLYLNVLPKGGGEAITKKSVWRNTKFVSYLGGVAVSYVLAKAGGRIISGDTVVKLSVYDYRLAVPDKSILRSIPFGKAKTS